MLASAVVWASDPTAPPVRHRTVPLNPSATNAQALLARALLITGATVSQKLVAPADLLNELVMIRREWIALDKWEAQGGSISQEQQIAMARKGERAMRLCLRYAEDPSYRLLRVSLLYEANQHCLSLFNVLLRFNRSLDGEAEVEHYRLLGQGIMRTLAQEIAGYTIPEAAAPLAGLTYFGPDGPHGGLIGQVRRLYDTLCVFRPDQVWPVDRVNRDENFVAELEWVPKPGDKYSWSASRSIALAVPQPSQVRSYENLTTRAEWVRMDGFKTLWTQLENLSTGLTKDAEMTLAAHRRLSDIAWASNLCRYHGAKHFVGDIGDEWERTPQAPRRAAPAGGAAVESGDGGDPGHTDDAPRGR